MDWTHWVTGLVDSVAETDPRPGGATMSTVSLDSLWSLYELLILKYVIPIPSKLHNNKLHNQ